MQTYHDEYSKARELSRVYRKLLIFQFRAYMYQNQISLRLRSKTHYGAFDRYWGKSLLFPTTQEVHEGQSSNSFDPEQQALWAVHNCLCLPAPDKLQHCL